MDEPSGGLNRGRRDMETEKHMMTKDQKSQMIEDLKSFYCGNAAWAGSDWRIEKIYRCIRISEWMVKHNIDAEEWREDAIMLKGFEKAIDALPDKESVYYRAMIELQKCAEAYADTMLEDPELSAVYDALRIAETEILKYI